MTNIVQQVFQEIRSKISSPQSFSRKLNVDPQGQENIPSINLQQSPYKIVKTPVKQVKMPEIQTMSHQTPQPIHSARAPQVHKIPQTPTADNEMDVKVYLRIRPLIETEEHADFNINENTVVAHPPPRSQSVRHFAERTFTFTEIFSAEALQKDIFDRVAMPILRKFMKGIDCLLFAYGATNAGKTFTVQGTENDPGLLPGTVRTLLAIPSPQGCERSLSISCVEVYNERIHDLLGDMEKSLRLGKDTFGYTVAKGTTEIELNSSDDLREVVNTIDHARKKSATAYNASSSRSHCVFTLKLTTVPMDPKTGERTTEINKIRCSRLSIVDLAGSERVESNQANSKTVVEACNINKSMLVLGRCIREIRKANKGSGAQIPFRESQLTELFRDYFEPGSRRTAVSIIVNISPNVRQFDDTLFSLQFAAEAVECNVKINGDSDEDDDLIGKALTFEDESGEPNSKAYRMLETKIRQEVMTEMTERLLKMQTDVQSQLEEMKAQSAQPYNSKLQQALAQRLQMENKGRELEECKAELESEKKKSEEYKNQINELEAKLNEAEEKLRASVEKEASLEANISKMIDATKRLHERHVQIQAELEEKSTKIEEFWQNKVKALEEQIRVLKGQKEL